MLGLIYVNSFNFQQWNSNSNIIFQFVLRFKIGVFAFAGPYLGSESNFRFFLCSILGVKDNVWEWNGQTICITELPLQLWSYGAQWIPWWGFKPSLVNHLTVPHPDAFSVYHFLKLVTGWFNDIHTLPLSFSIWKQKFQNTQYLTNLEKNVCVPWRYFCF